MGDAAHREPWLVREDMRQEKQDNALLHAYRTGLIEEGQIKSWHACG